MRASTLTARAFAMAMLMTTAGAYAQQPATPSARETPRPDQLEPGVNTSTTPPPDAAPTKTPTATPAAGTSDKAQTPVPKQAATQGKAPAAPASHSTKGGANEATPKTGPAGGTGPAAGTGPTRGTGAPGKAQDRLELDTTEITGNRELPKVLYIVPWKRSDLGDLVGKPVNSLLDEVLTPVDRDVFKRENRYYDALKPDQTGPGASATPGTGAGAGAGAKP